MEAGSGSHVQRLNQDVRRNSRMPQRWRVADLETVHTAVGLLCTGFLCPSLHSSHSTRAVASWNLSPRTVRPAPRASRGWYSAPRAASLRPRVLGAEATGTSIGVARRRNRNQAPLRCDVRPPQETAGNDSASPRATPAFNPARGQYALFSSCFSNP